MEKRMQIKIALGAAIGANCIPCFEHLYARAKEVKLTDEEIAEVLEVAFKVKSGAQLALQGAIQEVLSDFQAPQEPCSPPQAACSC